MQWAETWNSLDNASSILSKRPLFTLLRITQGLEESSSVSWPSRSPCLSSPHLCSFLTYPSKLFHFSSGSRHHSGRRTSFTRWLHTLQTPDTTNEILTSLFVLMTSSFHQSLEADVLLVIFDSLLSLSNSTDLRAPAQFKWEKVRKPFSTQGLTQRKHPVL